MAMAAGGFHAPQFTVSWPTGEFGGMGLEGAVQLGFRRELEAIVEGPERDALYRKLVEQQYEKGAAMNMAATLEIDAVIDPGETRRWLSSGLATGAMEVTGARGAQGGSGRFAGSERFLGSGRFIDTWGACGWPGLHSALAACRSPSQARLERGLGLFPGGHRNCSRPDASRLRMPRGVPVRAGARLHVRGVRRRACRGPRYSSRRPDWRKPLCHPLP
jgi:hypothetical protein